MTVVVFAVGAAWTERCEETIKPARRWWMYECGTVAVGSPVAGSLAAGTPAGSRTPAGGRTPAARCSPEEGRTLEGGSLAAAHSPGADTAPAAGLPSLVPRRARRTPGGRPLPAGHTRLAARARWQTCTT